MERLAKTLRQARINIEEVSRDAPHRELLEPVLRALSEAEAKLGAQDEGSQRESTRQPRAELGRAELERALRAHDEFLSTLGHELRNALSPLFMQAQYLLDVARNSEGGALAVDWLIPRLLKMCERLQRFLQTLERIMDVSRVTAGRLTLELEDVDFSELLLDVCSSMDREVELASSKLELDVATHVTGRWDRMRLEQICRNLLSNAVRYGAGKPIQVVLACDEARARLLVRDRGIGIAEQDQARIFQRFEQAGQQRHSGGFGIGLWIVQQSCRAMGGQVEVESQVGEGATFVVTLPRKSGASDV